MGEKKAMVFSCLEGAVLATVLLAFAGTGTEGGDFDISVMHVGKNFANGIGYNFAFLSGSKYPPIAEDVTFWCINP